MTETNSQLIVNIPYFQVYATDLVTYSMKLSGEQIKDIMLGISDICLFGETDFIPKDHISNLFFNKLHDDLKKNIKNYKTCVENGKKGGRPKEPKDNPSVNPRVIPQGNPSGNQTETETKTEDKTQTKQEMLKEFINWDWTADKLFKDWLNKKREKLTYAQQSNFTSNYVSNKKDAVVLHCESKGVKYKDYKATLQNWINRDISEGKL